VLCPLPRTATEALALVTELAVTVGACPIELDPVRHDRLAAAISHVPYLSALAVFAAAGALAQADPMAWRLAAGGFRSTTRLAGSEEQMMTDILLSNREAVLAQLERVQASLAQLAVLVTTGDEARLRDLAGTVRRQRSEFLQTHGS
jgi:prephenate dehydrogenase